MIPLNEYLAKQKELSVNEGVVDKINTALSLVTRTCSNKKVSGELIARVLKVSAGSANTISIILLIVGWIRTQLKEHPEMVKNIKNSYKNGELEKYLKTQLSSDLYKLAQDILKNWISVFGVLTLDKYEWLGLFS